MSAPGGDPGIIQYDHGRIAQHSGDVIGASKELESRLGDLHDYLKPLVSTWSGETAQAYSTYQRRWDEAAAGLQTILREVGHAASAGNQQMHDADRRAGAGWGV